MIYLGIDNGKSGAIAWIDERKSRSRGRCGVFPASDDFPHQMRDLVVGASAGAVGDVLLCVVEKPVIMPRQRGQLRIGIGHGTWLGILSALKVPWQVVTANRWQKSVMADMDRSNTKLASIRMAQSLFPEVDLRRTDRCNGPSDNLSDALLMAEYARRLARST